MHYPTPSIWMLRPYKLALPYETFPLTFTHRTSLENSLQLPTRCTKQEASLFINIFLSLVMYRIFTCIAVIFLKIFWHNLLLNFHKGHHGHPWFRLQSLCQVPMFVVKQLFSPLTAHLQTKLQVKSLVTSSHKEQFCAEEQWDQWSCCLQNANASAAAFFWAKILTGCHSNHTNTTGQWSIVECKPKPTWRNMYHTVSYVGCSGTCECTLTSTLFGGT